MRRRALSAISLLLFLSILTGCDPIYPIGTLKITEIESVPKGNTVNFEIIYPNTGGSIVTGWKEQNVEIINGDDIVAVSGFSITGKKSGTAVLRIYATTIISDEAVKAGYKEKIYSTEVKIIVE